MKPTTLSIIYLMLAIIAAIIIGFESNIFYAFIILSNIWSAVYYLSKDKS
jgi:hypothetical protein